MHLSKQDPVDIEVTTNYLQYYGDLETQMKLEQITGKNVIEKRSKLIVRIADEGQIGHSWRFESSDTANACS